MYPAQNTPPCSRSKFSKKYGGIHLNVPKGGATRQQLFITAAVLWWLAVDSIARDIPVSWRIQCILKIRSKVMNARHSIPTNTTLQLTITPELKRIVSLPSRPPASTGMIVQVTLVDTTRLFPSGRQSTALTMFHRSTTDPVDSRITTNSVYNQQTIPNTRQGGELC